MPRPTWEGGSHVAGLYRVSSYAKLVETMDTANFTHCAEDTRNTSVYCVTWSC